MAAPATLGEQIRVAEVRYFVAKRALDVALAALMLLILCPVMALVALLVIADSPGPAFFRQRRIGQDGVPFDMYKFRSMRQNNDCALHEAAVTRFMQGQRLNASAGSDTPYKLADDPRITRVGGVIRKLSIDELPQLWNVMRGEMSLVGPRPCVPYEEKMYSPHARRRLEAKPGLTGPWQVFGRGAVTYAEMIEMDLSYLSNRSLWYDVKLIALTGPVALFGRGGV